MNEEIGQVAIDGSAGDNRAGVNALSGSNQSSVAPPPLPPPPKKRVKKGRFRKVMLILLFVALGLYFVGNQFGVFSVSKDALSEKYGKDEVPHLNEIWSTGSGETKVVRVPLKGMIMLDGGGLFSGGGAQTRFALACIRRAVADSSVKGILLEVDSPGGGITSSDLVYKALKDFRGSNPARRVVVLMGDLAASGGYYVSLAADEIIAHPTTITGSIGVIMQSMNIHKLAERWGIEDQSVKSGDFKDMMNPLKPASTEHREVLQGIIDDMYDRFVALVAMERDLDETRVRELADGRVYVAKDALDSGLIDDIGYYEDAVDALSSQLGVTNLYVVRYETPGTLLDVVLGGRSSVSEAFEGLKPRIGSRMLYYWQP